MPPFIVCPGNYDFHGLGPLLALAFFGPIIGGIALDSWLHTFPAFMLIGFPVGFFAFLVVLFMNRKDFYD